MSRGDQILSQLEGGGASTALGVVLAPPAPPGADLQPSAAAAIMAEGGLLLDGSARSASIAELHWEEDYGEHSGVQWSTVEYSSLNPQSPFCEMASTKYGEEATEEATEVRRPRPSRRSERSGGFEPLRKGSFAAMGVPAQIGQKRKNTGVAKWDSVDVQRGHLVYCFVLLLGRPCANCGEGARNTPATRPAVHTRPL